VTSAAQKVADYLSKPKRLSIGGREVSAQSGETFEVVNPATEAVIATVAKGGAADIDAAVAAARKSFDSGSWRNLPAPQRAGIMQRLATLLLENLEELALIESNNNGMPIAMARASVMGSASWLNYFAGAVQRIHGKAVQESLSLPGEVLAYTRKEPIGVVGLITPWNGPIGTFLIKACPALAAGCSIVHKPSEVTPLSALRVAELALEAGIPEGVINIVPGFGADAGSAMANHTGIDKISFTGSTNVGKSLVQASAGNLKRVTLELGGKSPCVVFDDADMDVAIPGAAMAIMINCGQACFAGSRLFIQKKSFDKVLAGMADFMQNLKQGNPLEEDTVLGPLVSATQKKRVESYIEAGKAEGAELVHGGSHGMDKGYFVAPHIFAYTDPNIRIVREEIFGPVVAATPFEDLDDIVPRANDTNYGLGGGIFTTNINTAHRLAARIRTGNVWINSYSLMDCTMPFGGFKESGWGRELGEEGLDAYLETKSVFVKLA
jgi:acyl-CoA reductase-like NAD-dependent aldehyde dehydrogenase